jgi:hypothetical protein
LVYELSKVEIIEGQGRKWRVIYYKRKEKVEEKAKDTPRVLRT